MGIFAHFIYFDFNTNVSETSAEFLAAIRMKLTIVCFYSTNMKYKIACIVLIQKYRVACCTENKLFQRDNPYE